MNKKRIVYIDCIRVLAMLLVVLAHTLAPAIANKNVFSSTWKVSNSIITVTEVAVPLFFMISGSNILNSDKTLDIRYLFKHRLSRVLIPFLIWSIVSALFLPVLTNTFNINIFINQIILIYHKPILTAYWFVYPLISLNLVSPILKTFVDDLNIQVIKYSLLLWIIITILLPACANILPPHLGELFNGYPLGIIIKSSSIGYFILGYILSKNDLKILNSKKLLAATIIVGLVINIIINNQNKFSALKYLTIVARINIPIISMLIFLYFKKFEGTYNKMVISIVGFLSPLTYGIYLSHGLIISIFERFQLNYFEIFTGTILMCTVVIYFLRCIPIIKRLFT